jgi:hypothetical protein
LRHFTFYRGPGQIPAGDSRTYCASAPLGPQAVTGCELRRYDIVSLMTSPVDLTRTAD